MRATSVTILSVTAALFALPAIAGSNSKSVPVEVWRGGDDGLTIKLSEAVERALAASGRFSLSRGKLPGTLLITFPHNVVAKPDRNRLSVEYEATFSTIGNRVLGAVKSGCHEDELVVCVDEIVETATAAAEWLSIDTFVLPRDGDYLSTAYIAALDKTKSHKKAWGTGSPQSIGVSRDKRGLVLSLNWNWHEGDGVVFDPKNPTAMIGSGRTFIPTDTTHFRFQDGKVLLTYQYVGSESKYITEKLLIGTYKDTRGRRYVFGSDGKAHWPDRTFRYEIYTDMVFEQCDEIWDRDASKPNEPAIFGFVWRGNMLYLYNANCSDEQSPGCIVDRKNPIAVLHKVT
ncbi:hypothetical protein [Rhizomicrobium electricum]|uniref:Uncharacterized protein n=1 Tax=Rhizomicrobium electricum TaxID=480070 RepID=A0ABN1E999_9PROT|nr:hypothetical protein [Rhizomicrobium electricum]NIJ47856.1 hypothetical protein [Rhizomicrobium electricum]